MQGAAPSRTSASSAPPEAPERLEILHAEGRDVVGLWQNVLVLVFREPATPEGLRRAAVFQREAARRFPGGFAALAVLPELPREGPLGALRAEAVKLTALAPPELRAVAEVIEGTGFVTATLRSIATGLVLFARPPWPMRIFNGIEPAAAWIASWVDREARPTAPRRLASALRHTLV